MPCQHLAATAGHHVLRPFITQDISRGTLGREVLPGASCKPQTGPGHFNIKPEIYPSLEENLLSLPNIYSEQIWNALPTPLSYSNMAKMIKLFYVFMW